MKKLIFILGVLMMASFANAKSIVVYYSKTGEQYGVGTVTEGNTAKVAKEIASQTGADILELKTAKKYPEGYKAMTEEAMKEMCANDRPPLAVEIPDMAQYDTVFIGYPIWWGDAPMCVYTFLDAVDLSGKTIRPFCTHEGSGAAGTQGKLKKAEPNATVESVLAIRGTTAQNNAATVKKEVSEWLGK